ncbi:MAG: peptide ABC transporter substrate-binding protein [Candidatus Eremiobacteraeota bacterium]|nr:peptide ABC transporter substrate-binding protein [Candidatus Eremiobacteraeota bacterium]MBC5826167.1 peptide ABC transporter substrate-binding protein [Candidatus Eremiobacteraeota bacterium]
MHRTLAGFICVGLAAVCGCSGPSQQTHSRTLRVAIEQDVKTLNPLLASSTVDGFVQRLMFEPLVSADERGQPVPILATEVPSTANRGISRDGLTIVYHLRKNAKWSDGIAITSKDVQFSWAAILNPHNNVVSRHGYDDVVRIDTPDASTVVAHLKRPFAPFVNTFFGESDQPYAIVPAHVLSKYPDINRIAFDEHPTVTDGPFLFQAWAHGDRLTFVRNDRFFFGKPKLDHVEVHVVPDENTGVNLLRTHEIDYMYEPSIVTFPAISRIPGVRIVWVNVNGYIGLALNTAHAALSSPGARQALALALDKPRLVNTLTFGQERVATADLPDWLWAANPHLRVPKPDLVASRAMLQRYSRNAKSLLLVTDTANATFRRAAVQVQSMFAAVGLKLTIRYYPADLLYAPAGMGGIVHGGKFDIVMWPWYAGIDPDNSSQFLCSSQPPNGYNDARYCHSEMESLQNQALTTYDRGLRRAAYWKIESLVVRDNPIIPLWYQRQQEAIDARFKGFAPNPVVESWNAWQWSI